MAGGSSAQMKTKAGKIIEMLQHHPGTVADLRKGNILLVFGMDLL